MKGPRPFPPHRLPTISVRLANVQRHQQAAARAISSAAVGPSKRRISHSATAPTELSGEMSCHFLFQDHRPLIHDTGPTTFTTLPQSIHPRSTRRNGHPPAPPASTASGLLPPSSIRYVSSSPPGSTSPRPSSASHVFSTSTGPAPTHCHCLSLLQETQGQSKCPIVQRPPRC